MLPWYHLPLLATLFACGNGLAAATHLDFEAPDAYFSGDTYYEGGKSYRHDNASNIGSYTKGLGPVAGSGAQGMWLRVPGNPTAVQDSTKMSRREWHFGTMAVNTNTWYRYSVRFNQEHQVTAWYGTIINQVRYDGSGYGFNLGLYLNKGSNPSGPIPLAYRYMEGNTADSASYDSGIIPTSFSFQRDRWYDVLVNYYLDTTSARIGFYHVWVDGQQVVNQNNIGNQRNTNGAIRLGQYGRVERQTRHVHFDDFRQGTSLAEVGGSGPGIPAVAVPTFSPPSSTFSTASIAVALSCATTGAAIRYTTDGTTPTASSSLYAAPLTISQTTTVRAIGMKDGQPSSTVASATYTKTINQAPTVNAGPDLTLALPTATVALAGTVSDDGLPSGGSLTSQWSLDSGPAAVAFSDASTLDSTATFTTAGTYILRLTASDSSLQASDTMSVVVEADPGLSGLPVTVVTASASQAPNLPENTRDGDLNTRWSAEGVGQWISFDLGAPYTVEALQLAWYLGSTRSSFFSVQTSLDGVAWSTVLANASSSGTTTGLETMDIPETLARFVRILGGGNSVNAWNSLCEARILGHAGVLPLSPVQATASSSQDPNLPANAYDGNLVTRWSAEGVGQWISFDLGGLALVQQLELAWYQGNTRRTFFSVQVSTDGSTWTTILANAASSGTTAGFEAVAIPPTTTRFVRILGGGNSVNAWNSLSEIRLLGLPAGAG